jgi:hypothetical protein
MQEEDGDAGMEMSADEGMASLNPVEMKFMTGWNEIMYASLRRRNAVGLPKCTHSHTHTRVHTLKCVYARAFRCSRAYRVRVFIYMHVVCPSRAGSRALSLHMHMNM